MRTDVPETTDYQRSDEIDLYHSLEILWRFRVMILSLVVAAMSVAAAVSWWVIPEKYEAESFVQVGLGETALGSSDVYRKVLVSKPVLSRVSRSTKLPIQQLKKTARAEVVPNTNVLRLIVTLGSPQAAEALGGVWHDAFLHALNGLSAERLDRQLASQRARVNGMKEVFRQSSVPIDVGDEETSGIWPLFQGNLASISVALGELNRLEALRDRVRRNRVDDVQVISGFEATGEPVGPRKVLNVVAAGFLALMLGIMLPFAIEGWGNHAVRRTGVVNEKRG